MRRYNTVPLILLILSIINFALAAPVPMPEKCQSVDMVHVPKDVITVLGKRGDDLELELEKIETLFDNFGTWWGEEPEEPESSSAVRPPSSTAPLESGHEPMDVDVPPASPASPTESDSEYDSMPSLESVSDEPPPNPESSIVDGYSHTLPLSPESSTESEQPTESDMIIRRHRAHGPLVDNLDAPSAVSPRNFKLPTIS
jgi:hypothetical protein